MNNKVTIEGFLAVEGKMDVAFLESFLDTNFITTNGSEISKDTINYIKELKQDHRVIVLTDPDSPGERIRNILNEHIDGLEHAYVHKNVSIKKHKVGVAESTKEEVLNALKNAITNNKNNKGSLTMNDLYELGLIGNANSEQLRLKIGDKLNLGYCSTGKTLLKRLNSIGVTKNKLKELL